MTVTNQTNKTRQSGNGVTVTFNFNFKIFDENDLEVYKIDTSTTPETATLQTITTDYTVAISQTSEGGSVTFTTAPTSDEDAFIKRVLDFTQETDIVINSNFPEKDIEDELDKSRMIDIQVDEATDRTLQVSEFYDGAASFEIPNPEASKVIGWAADGVTMANYASTDLDQAIVTSFGETLVTSIDAEAARDTLELGTSDDVEFNSITATTYSGLPDASTTAKGISELATLAEVQADTGGDKVVTSDVLNDIGLNNIVKLDTQTISSALQIAITDLDSTYKKYIIEIINLRLVTDSESLYMQISQDNGSTWKSGASDYKSIWSGYNANATLFTPRTTGGTQIFLNDVTTDLGNDTGESFDAILEVINPASTTFYKHIKGQVTYNENANVPVSLVGMGDYQTDTNAINAIRFYASSGNIDQAIVKVYGVK